MAGSRIISCHSLQPGAFHASVQLKRILYVCDVTASVSSNSFSNAVARVLCVYRSRLAEELERAMCLVSEF